jgi:calmodulin
LGAAGAAQPSLPAPTTCSSFLEMGNACARAETGDVVVKKSRIDKFDERTLDDFRSAFNTFDKDGGGSIDAKELKELMNTVGTNPTDKELDEMIAMADADGSGSIDFAEFVTLMAHNMTDEKSVDDLKKAFQVFDSDGSGNISPDELQRIMINVGEPVSLEDVNKVISEADEDGDGEINFEEVCATRPDARVSCVSCDVVR